MTQWFNQVVGSGGFGALDRVIQFTEARHTLLANNVANIDTPGYKMRDLQVEKFQGDLQKAIADRSVDAPDAAKGRDRVDFNQYLLFHDQNNRSVEKQMTAMTQNAMMHNVAVELLRSRYGVLEKAISLKP